MVPLSKFRKEYSHTIQSGVSLDSVQYIINHEFNNYDFDVYLESIDENLQRGLCWTLQQKQSFIEFMLAGGNVPQFIVVNYKLDKHDVVQGANSMIVKVIDGKQRLTTMISFIKNEFPLVVDGEDVYFRDLEISAQIVISGFTPTTELHWSWPI